MTGAPRACPSVAIREVTKQIECPGTDVVLDPLGILFRRLWVEAEPDQEAHDNLVALAAFFGDPTGWKERLDCWRSNWRELPFYGPPPALVDWLPVDLSPDGDLATVFVPPWGGGDEPLHEALKQG